MLLVLGLQGDTRRGLKKLLFNMIVKILFRKVRLIFLDVVSVYRQGLTSWNEVL